VDRLKSSSRSVGGEVKSKREKVQQLQQQLLEEIKERNGIGVGLLTGDRDPGKKVP